ncbi:MAG: hypothetical protein C0403_02140 [Desulfobacterium sp.]|nr:hypothetical protein [Desulfobacterium sp.]
MNHFNTNKKNWLTFRTEIWICLFLCITTLSVYIQVIDHGFTSIDDNIYIYENANVIGGLTKNNIAWAFHFTQKGDHTYYHPLSLISHMIDCHLFELQPGKHHLVNLFIHLTNTLLLFILFRIMTKSIWRSAFISAFFSLHPLNVDTVAWIAERKNLLSTFFWFSTILAYYYYSQKPGLPRYILVFLLMMAGLLCKPMLVTLPCVLLLLDFWPLERIQFSHILPIRKKIYLILEKIPLLGLSLIWSYLSSLSMSRLDLTIPIDWVPLDIRIANAIMSYTIYLHKMLWPYDLAIYYPYPSKLPPIWQITCVIVFLTLISVFVLRTMKKMPWMAVGWLWYLGTLLPVLGLVQNGLWPKIADRWTYVPMIGIFIMITWGISEILKGSSKKKNTLIVLSNLFLIIMAITTWNQIRYWREDIKLFSHAVDVTENNVVAQSNLSYALQKQHRYAEAIPHFLQALRLKPNSEIFHNNLGNAYTKINNHKEAIKHFKEALRINPVAADPHNNLGNALQRLGKFEDAFFHYSKAIEIKPENESTYYNVGLLFEKQNRMSEAIEYYQEAVQKKPDYANAHLALGNVLFKIGMIQKAETHYVNALKTNPNLTEAKTNLDIIQSYIKKIDTSVHRINEQIIQTPKNHLLYYHLGELYEKKEEVSAAFVQYQKANTLEPFFIPAIQRLAILHAARKEYDQSIFYLKQMIKFQPEVNKHYYNIACIYAKQDNIKESILWLSKAIRRGYSNWQTIKTDPDLKNIRKTKDFKTIMETNYREK